MKIQSIVMSWLKKYYFPIFTIIYLMILLWKFPFPEKQLGIVVSSTGMYLSALYFFQKQNLEELKAFKELFVEFNSRYDKLNNKLNNISEENSKDILDDYFNLCAEEYLFYKKGLIIEEAWSSWCRGMREQLKEKIISEYWTKAQQENSYYGLTSDIINVGANH
jgi:hypothetical protein